MKIPVDAFVLNSFVYGETSLIIRLYTREMGSVSCLLRGALKKKYSPERGARITMDIQRRGEQGLFSAYSCEELSHFSCESSLLKTALRDTALELLLIHLHEEEAHEDIFSLLEKYVSYLSASQEEFALYALWLFTVRLSQYLGFEYNLFICSRCGSTLRNAQLIPQDEGFVCESCSPRGICFSSSVLGLLQSGKPGPGEVLPQLSSAEKQTITRQLLDFLIYQNDTSKQHKSRMFLFEIL
jgi:DNA repair protein RecO